MNGKGYLLIVIIAALVFSSCNMIAVRPRFESIDGDVDVDAPGPGREIDTGFQTFGIEVAYLEYEDLELFADLSSVELENNDTGWSEDGYEIGLGARSHFAREEGSSIDWGARINHLRVEENLGGGIDDDVTFQGFTGNFGPAFSFAMGDSIFTIHGGAKALVRIGDEKVTGQPTSDLDIYSLGLYAGFALTDEEPSQVEFRADFFAGTESMKGFLILAGVRF